MSSGAEISTHDQKGNDLSARQLWRPLLFLFLLALALRLIYLIIALNFHGLDRFWHITPDTDVYWAVASEILGGHPDGPYALFRVGPGYGFIIAIFRVIFGDNPIFPLLFSILMGALAAVAVYLFSFSLFRSRKLAMAAGIISAFSITSISLSVHILTDQTYFTMQCLALFILIEGIRKNHLGWQISSGLLTGAGALVRPTGQIWPIFLLAIPLLIGIPYGLKSRWQLFRRVAPAGAVALAIVLAWCTRNYVVTGNFAFGSNGMLTVRNCMVGMIEAKGNRGQVFRIRDKFSSEDGDISADYGNAYRLARKRVWKAAREHTAEMLSYYFAIVWENVREPDFYLTSDLPLERAKFGSFFDSIERFNTVLALLTLIGLTVLGVRRNRSAFVILNITFWAFTILLGFSFWQGSRLHYPAEMAWAVLLPYTMLWLWFWLAALLGRITHKDFWLKSKEHARFALARVDNNKL